MKTKILMCVISFIFLILLYSKDSYCATNKFENVEQDIKEIQIVEFPKINRNVSAVNDGTMYLDTPVYGETFFSPRDSKLQIKGWAVSNDSEATVRVLLDGNLVAENILRHKRGDVDEAISPMFGGTNATQNAGFSTDINIEQLSEGTHIIRVEQLSKNGAILSSFETCINIEKIVYTGTMYIDSPTYGKSYIRPDAGKIEIKGWAVSTDSGAILRVLLDGNVVAENISRHQREDVDVAISPNYGGKENTLNAGFYAEIETNDFTAGNHALRVEQISSYGELISAYETIVNIANKKYEGTMYIDSPIYGQSYIRPDVGKIEIKGWAVSTDSGASVRVLLDGKVVAENISRHQREDVDVAISPNYGGRENTPNAGFNTEIDADNFTAGNHALRVEEISRYDELISAYETIVNIANKKYEGTMYIDSPIYGQSYIRPDVGKIEIKGWAVSTDSGASVRVLLDGKVVAENISRHQRGDVDVAISPNYGGTENTPNAGFFGELNTNNFIAGNHALRVEAISRYGELICAYETIINIANKKYLGTMNLDTPQNNIEFIKQDVSKVQIQGWAVSTDSEAVLRILLDGNILLENLIRHKRDDVDVIISPQYGGIAVTPNAGFLEEINISTLPTGVHKLSVQQVSRYGDIISNYEIQIQISNKKYLGEMCLDSPTFNQTYDVADKITIKGWAVAEDEFATVEIYVDGVFKGQAQRYYRQDVEFYMQKYGKKTVDAGFGKLLNASEIGTGTHKLTVYEKSRYGDIIGGIEVNFIIKSPTIIENEIQDDTDFEDTNWDSSDNTPDILTSGSKGIDVSQYQGNIDWKKVADSGIKFAMIRIGYRGYGTGGFAEDTKFKTNFSNAVANGLKVGVYFYSTAINTSEAEKDAEYVVSLLKKYGYQNKVSMPIAMDLELISGVNTRDKNVSKNMRTNIANTFCNKIASYGYTPMVYACKSFLNDNMNASQIKYDVWVAQYNSKCTYKGAYTMWQYTSSGKVLGINGNVDCNICYKNY